MSGCYGGSYGGWGYGGGYYGGGWGCHGGYGGCYGYGCNGGGNYAPTVVPPGAPGSPASEPVPPPKKVGELRGQNDIAQLVFELPAEAKLYVDDHLISTASNQRVFNTPTLRPELTYYYIVRAELNRNGQIYSSSQLVSLRSGQIIQATFSNLERMAATPLRGQITAQR